MRKEPCDCMLRAVVRHSEEEGKTTMSIKQVKILWKGEEKMFWGERGIYYRIMAVGWHRPL